MAFCLHFFGERITKVAHLSLNLPLTIKIKIRKNGRVNKREAVKQQVTIIQYKTQCDIETVPLLRVLAGFWPRGRFFGHCTTNFDSEHQP
jgi:hypothetical protein